MGFKSGEGATGDATAANQTTIIGHVDGVETLLTAIETAVEIIDDFISGARGLVTEDNSAAIAASLAIMDDWDESDRAKVALPGELSGPGTPTVDSFTHAAINVATGANSQIIAAPGASKQIWIFGFVGTADVAGSVSIQDEDDTALSGVMPVAATGGFVVPPSGNFAMPWIKVATNKAVELDCVTCTFDGVVSYAIVSV